MEIFKLGKSVSLVVILALLVPFAAAQQPGSPDIRPLALGSPVERQLRSDEVHTYSLAITAGQFLQLVVEQKGIDVVVVLFAPDGKKLAEVDSPNGAQGPEPLSLIVDYSGDHRLEVRSLEKDAAPGLYEAKIVQLRPATEKDRKRAAAVQAVAEAGALVQQGTAESLRNAIKRLEEALPLFRAAAEKMDEAITFNNIGVIYSHLGEKQEALENLSASLPLLRDLGDKPTEAQTLNNIGKVQADLGNRDAALKSYDAALSLFRGVGDKRGEAITLNNIGAVYLEMGDKPKGFRLFTESLPLFRAAGDKLGEAAALSNLGAAYSDVGDNQQALKYYYEALPLRRTVGDRAGEAATLNNIAVALSETGDNRQALKVFDESLPLLDAIGDKLGYATALGNIGVLYSGLGDREQALAYHNRSLPIRREIGDKRGEAVTLNNIAKIHSNKGEHQLALKIYLESLQIMRDLADKPNEARTLNNIGQLYSEMEDNEQALKWYNESLPVLRAVDDKGGEAYALNNIGKAHYDRGDKAEGLKFHYRSLPLFRAVGDKHGEAVALNNIFFNLVTRNPRLAVFFGKRAVDNLQALRSNVHTLDKNLQQVFLKSVESTYRFLSEELIRQERFGEAQQVLNAFKDQQFFDLSNTVDFAPPPMTVREAEIAAAYDQKLEKVVSAIRALDELRRGTEEGTPAAETSAEWRSLEAKPDSAQDEFLSFLASAGQDFAGTPGEKDTPPDVADLRIMQAALAELSAQRREKSVAVYALVGEANYRALVITPDDVFSVSTAVKGDQLNRNALRLWTMLRSPKYDPKPAANDLYRIVFKPLEGRLPKDTGTILWSLDGSLRYIPVAALYDGRKYLVERYQNAVFTRADKDRMTRRLSSDIKATGFGSSKAHTVEFLGQQLNAAALPAVKVELQRLFRSQGSGGILDGSVLLDEGFTKTAMLAALKERRPLVHIASHFLFEPGNEARSFLLLGDGSPYTLDEMRREPDLFHGVDLLTLSACQTAAQRPDANGREVDGFAELAQRLGAGAVMASLWEVADNSTAELMTRFYRNYRGGGGMNKSQALRDAQMDLLKGKYREDVPAVDRQLVHAGAGGEKADFAKLKLHRRDKKAPFAHPYYWSPFILIGNLQ